MDKKVYVQFGCGWENVPSTWINYDSSPTLRFEKIPFLGRLYTKNKNRFPKFVKYGDISKGLPHEENSVDGIYCSHVLEHIQHSLILNSIKNTYKILKKGKIFRMVLPDLEFLINDYLNDSNILRANTFVKNTYFVDEKKTFLNFMFNYFGGSKHLWLYDYNSLKHYLELSGFQQIRRAYFNNSTDIKFKEVEIESRWVNCLGIECLK